MFSWIEKVIPQPPETPRKFTSDGQECTAPPTVVADKCAEKDVCVTNESGNPPADTNVQNLSTASDKSSEGVLSWLAQGLGKVVPQPVDSPSLARVNKEVSESVVEEKPKPAIETVEKKTENGPTDQTESSSTGVLSWLSHSLEKVVPQPTWAHRTSISGSSEQSTILAEQKPQAEEKAERSEEMNIPPVSPVHRPVTPPMAAPIPAPAEAPQTSTLEAEVAVPDKGSGSGVLNWLMQGLGKVVPQPEPLVVVAKKVEEEKPKEEEPPAPPPAARKDSKARVLSWISQGLEKVIPQPVTQQDSHNAMLCQVEEKGSGV